MCKTAVDGGEWYDDINIEHDAGVAPRDMVRAFLCGLLNIDDATVGLIDLDGILETEAEDEAA